MIPVPDPADDLLYPDTDGRPMAESDFQREPLSYAAGYKALVRGSANLCLS